MTQMGPDFADATSCVENMRTMYIKCIKCISSNSRSIAQQYRCVRKMKKGKETLGFTSTETSKAYSGRGSWGVKNFTSNIYSLHCHHQNESALMTKVGRCVSHFNVSLIVWAKAQDGVHKPQFLKRRERRAEADRTKVLLLTSQAPYR